MIQNALTMRWLGWQDYSTCWQAMQKFTNERSAETMDEIWFLEHHPVFTQGQNGKPEHILNAGDIPIVQTDRGGQVTYHGPGQLMVYFLIDLRRKHLNVRALVSALEQSIVDLLNEFNVNAYAKCDAPGVYIDEKKICSIGLRIRKGCSYHGIAFNIAMDLEPFKRINPCGFQSLQMTQLIDYTESQDPQTASEKLIPHLQKNLGYTTAIYVDHTYSESINGK
jgi:lipoyl(octanoyl) transferase